jgi:hypothetical protein
MKLSSFDVQHSTFGVRRFLPPAPPLRLTRQMWLALGAIFGLAAIAALFANGEPLLGSIALAWFIALVAVVRRARAHDRHLAQLAEKDRQERPRAKFTVSENVDHHSPLL